MTAAAGTGYSGKPLAAKLGLKAGSRVHLMHAPPELLAWLDPLPAGVVFEPRPAAGTDIVHLFVTRQADLARELSGLRSCLGPAAVLWVSWPKKAARRDTARSDSDITEDRIRDLALPLGFVDVKVCAVSPVWSGLKLVVRKALR